MRISACIYIENTLLSNLICYILGHSHQSEKELFAEAEKERKAREDEVRSLQTSSCFHSKSSLYN